ncbi:MAG: ABC transporter permease [Acidimicrobiales bacterium]
MDVVSLRAVLPGRTVGALTRGRVVGGVGVGLGLVMIFVFALGTKAGLVAQLGLSGRGAYANVPAIPVPARSVCLALGVVTALAGAYQAVADVSRKVSNRALGAELVLFFFCLLSWAAAGKSMSLIGLGNGTMVRSIPLVLGALAGILSERAGVINIAIEGQFLVGAFAGALIGSAAANLWLGLVGAAVGGALIAAILAFFSLRYLVDQVIMGIVLDVFALGLTSYLYDRLLVPNQNALNSPNIFSNIQVPVLGHIPIIGPVFFDSSILLYITYILLIVIHVALFHTRWGLRVRAVGEHPLAADTVGIKVVGTRYANMLLGGLVAGLGGAYFTIGSVGAFGKDISSGEGFIALAAVIFGGWKPRGALFAALLFGFADALQNILGILGSGIPSEFLLMAPYLATILAVAGLVGHVRPPGADGKPYVKS